jgi:hypothetical protein
MAKKAYLIVKTPKGRLVQRFFGLKARNDAAKLIGPDAEIISAARAQCYINAFRRIWMQDPEFPFWVVP